MSDSKIFEYPYLIREHHLDTFGHVNHAVYLEIFEEARWEILNQNNYGIKRIRETGIGPTILEVLIRYQRELLLGQKVVVKTQMFTLENKVFTLKHWMDDPTGKTTYCTADIKMCLFDVNIRKMVTPTKEWLEPLSSP